MEYKEVTWRALKPGDEVHGWRVGNCHTFAKAVVASVSPAFVTVFKWGKFEEKIDAETAYFEVEMSEREFKAKYAAAAKEVVKALQVKLQDYECGYHEIWNAWLSPDPYELAAHCAKHKIRILGHMVLPYPKNPMSVPEMQMDIGVCCAYEDGERFWCHACSSWLKDMQADYGELWAGKAVKEGEKGE